MCTQIHTYREGHNLSRFLRRPREACSPKWQLIYLGCSFKMEREGIGGIIMHISTHNETSQEHWLHIELIDMSLELSLKLCEFVGLCVCFSCFCLRLHLSYAHYTGRTQQHNTSVLVCLCASSLFQCQFVMEGHRPLSESLLDL